jgi:hypothetical protein
MSDFVDDILEREFVDNRDEPTDFEKELETTRIAWRAFFCDDQGIPKDTPDEVFAYAYRAALKSQLVHRMAEELRAHTCEANQPCQWCKVLEAYDAEVEK